MASDRTGLRQRFRNVVMTEDELRAVLGHPKQRTIDKVVTSLDEASRRFIAASPFLLISSVMENGLIDVSPKGDPAGFVQVLDDRTLAIPDRLGNRRGDTMVNILRNPNIGLIFLIPGVTHTLRVSGAAAIVRDEELRQSLAVDGKLPDQAIVVAVEHVLAHCPKCMTRSGLWQPDAWGDPTDVPTLAETLVAHAKLAIPVGEMQEIIDEDGRTRLY